MTEPVSSDERHETAAPSHFVAGPDEAEAGGHPAASQPRIVRLARHPAAWAIVAVLLAVVAVVGSQLVGSTPHPSKNTTTMNPRGGLAIFDEPFSSQDRIPLAGTGLEADFTGASEGAGTATGNATASASKDPIEAASSRYLGEAYGWKAWAAKSTKGQVCLVATAALGSMVHCLDEASVRAAGLSVTIPRSQITDSDIPSGKTLTASLRLTWGPHRLLTAAAAS